MTIIQRRIFYGKVGAADELVTWARQMYDIVTANSPGIPYRVMTDFQSGRTDRVVVDVELEDMAQLGEALEAVMADADTQRRFGEAMERLKELANYAEVEQWAVQD